MTQAEATRAVTAGAVGMYLPKAPASIFALVPDDVSWQLDVVCHEYVHALIDFWHPATFLDPDPARIVESRAIHEGTADLMSTLAELRTLDPQGDWNTQTHGSSLPTRRLDDPGALQYCPSASVPACVGSRWLEIGTLVNQDAQAYVYGALVGTWGYLVTVGTGGQPLQNALGCSHEVLPARSTFGESSTLLNQLLAATFTEYPPGAPLDIPHFAQATFDLAMAKWDPTAAASVLQAWAVKNVSVFPERSFPFTCPRRADGTVASSTPKAAWAAELCCPVADEQASWHATITDPVTGDEVATASASEFIEAADGTTHVRAVVPVPLNQRAQFTVECVSNDSCSNRAGVFETGSVEVSLRAPAFAGDADASAYWVFGTFGASAGQCAEPFECSPGDLPPDPAPVGPVWDAVPGTDHYLLRVSSSDDPACSLSPADASVVPAGAEPEVTCPPGSCLPSAEPLPNLNFLQIQPVHATGLVGTCRSFPFRQVDDFALHTIVAQPGDVQLEWDPIGDETAYEVTVYAAGAESPLFEPETVSEPTTIVPLEEGYYTWQVTALLSGGSRLTSSLQRLTVASPIDVVDEDERSVLEPFTFEMNATHADQFLVDAWAVDHQSGERIDLLAGFEAQAENAGATTTVLLPQDAFAGKDRHAADRQFVRITARYNFPGGPTFVQHSDEVSFDIRMSAEIVGPDAGDFVDDSFFISWQGEGATEYRIVVRRANGAGSIFTDVFMPSGPSARDFQVFAELFNPPWGEAVVIEITPNATATGELGVARVFGETSSVTANMKHQVLLVGLDAQDASAEYCGQQFGAHFFAEALGPLPGLDGFDFSIDSPFGGFSGTIPYCGENIVRFPINRPEFSDGLHLLFVEPQSADDRYIHINDPPLGLALEGVGDCGVIDEPCCEGLQCSAGECQNLMCVPGTGGGPPTSVSECSDFITAGSNQQEVHEVELGQPSGTVTFTIDTLTVPDRLEILYEGALIQDTGCFGTRTLNDGCSDPWCCDSGVCSADIPYSGSSTRMAVRVTPNCAGTPDTEWIFSLSCP